MLEDFKNVIDNCTVLFFRTENKRLRISIKSQGSSHTLNKSTETFLAVLQEERL